MSRSFMKIATKSSQIFFVSLSPAVIKSNRLFERCVLKHCHSGSTGILTMADVRKQLDQWMDFQEGYVKNPPDRSHLLQYLPESQDELPVRRMKDSYSEAIIPLSTKLKLHQRYSTVTGKLRMGRVMEDIDFFAVYIALKHLKNPKWVDGQPSPYVIVTAAVDDMEFTLAKPDVHCDVKLSGSVVNAGRSSLDICIKLETLVGSTWKQMTSSHFTMVARNSTLTGPAIVNKLVLETNDEAMKHMDAEERKERKKAAAKMSLLTHPPNPLEQQLIHEKFISSVDLNDVSLNKRILPEGSVWMEESILTGCHFPHPENRNHHNTVFGGYLMRQALELAWMTAFKYSAQKPSLRYISNITFKHSISLSSFLQIMSQVIFTEGNYMQIAIFIEMLDIATGKAKTTNSFYFTYQVRHPVRPIMPKTYHEAILWIEGQREYKKAKLKLDIDSVSH